MMRNYQPLGMILLIFLTPLLAAAYVLSHRAEFNFNNVQHGTLIQPARAITFTNLNITKNKWHVIYLAPDVCNADCANQKKILSNLHTALGANKDRVVFTTTTSNISSPLAKDGSIVIINPLGLYIMHYPANSDPSGLLKDLKRLLKYSHAS